MNDWLKNLKAGDYVLVPSLWGARIVKITGETKCYWTSGVESFRKDNGRIKGSPNRTIKQVTQEIIDLDRLYSKRRKLENQIWEAIKILTESDIDAITAIIKGRLG